MEARQLTHPDYNEALGTKITSLCGNIYAATYRLLELIREFDQRKAWTGIGAYNCAHWLNITCGMGMNSAHEKVWVARALAELPLISAAFGRGEISYSKVRAMTRVARRNRNKNAKGKVLPDRYAMCAEGPSL